MKIWIPSFYTEAHRSTERQAELVSAFNEIGVHCVPELEPNCDLCFCGAIRHANTVRRYIPKGMPLVHYNWDLYPYMIENCKTLDWKGYIRQLRDCKLTTMIVTPSQCTSNRTMEYTDRSSTVVLSPVKVWDVPEYNQIGDGVARIHHPKSYVVDVMRGYHWDPCVDWTVKACRKLRIPLIRTLTSTPWDVFRYTIANARLLLSCFYEASTGGLTLLEGYAHGVRSLVSDSPRMGAVDYLGSRANYFRHQSLDHLIYMLQLMWNDKYEPDSQDNRRWVETQYSELRFTNDMKKVFQSCLN